MKKIILIAAIAVCSISSYAQLSYGGQIGGNLGMGHFTNDDPYLSSLAIANDPKVGFMIGVVGQVEFGKLAFRPELNFVQKGSKNGGSSLYYTSVNKLTLNYIEVPLNVTYNLEVGKVGKVFFGLGPAIGIGLGGKNKYSESDGYDYYSAKADVKFDGKKDSELSSDDVDTHLKRVDVGANIIGGLQLPMGLFAKVGFQLGLIDLNPNDNSKYKNRGVSLCVGYMFGGGDKKKK
ncbi:MAG: porin family protein [Ferruginibacter sp.]